MKTRLAKKIWKQRDDSLFPPPNNYWANKWSNTQFYEGAIYDHRLAKVERIMAKIIKKESEREYRKHPLDLEDIKQSSEALIKFKI